MTTLYAVLTGGDHDNDATLHGIYTSREMAEEAMRRYGADRIEEQQADVLPDLHDDGYAWAVSVMYGVVTPRYESIDFANPARSRFDGKTGVIYCFAKNATEAAQLAMKELPRLQNEHEQRIYDAAVETQRRIEAGELQVVGITREMLINDNLQPFAVGMLGSMWGKRP